MNKAMPTYLKAQIDKFLERGKLPKLTQEKQQIQIAPYVLNKFEEIEFAS